MDTAPKIGQEIDFGAFPPQVGAVCCSQNSGMAVRFQVAIFGKQFFKSSNAKVENSYKEGVNAVSRGDYLKAYQGSDAGECRILR